MTAFLIDMDGTLVDSHRVVEASWTDFANRHGLSPAECIAYCTGRPAIDTAVHFLGAGEVAEREAAEMAAREETIDEGIVEIPGAKAFVASIPDGHWALVTSANRSLASRRLEQIDVPLPEVMICSEDITTGKPDPQPYLFAAKALGEDPANCIALEDSDSGVRSAMAAGCRVVVVGGMTTFDGQLRRVPDLAGVTADALLA